MTQKKSNKAKAKSERILLLGFPGNGLIGTFTISYIISRLQMQLIGEINHPEMPPTI
ncbi:MAG: PAC2 family protein, partial [Candidatus Nitrosotenuis sp.]|nr:PAC2 family protein [Candidatus Nitrosotenuis sp.]